MATEIQRPKLDVYHVSGLLRQALFTCWSNIWLLLTVALLSSVFETAVERWAIVPGLGLSSSNVNLSFQFSLDPNQPPQASLHRYISDGISEGTPLGKEAIVEESFLSRLLSLVIPSDSPLRETVEESPAVDSVSKGIAEPPDIKHVSPSIESERDVIVGTDEKAMTREVSENNGLIEAIGKLGGTSESHNSNPVGDVQEVLDMETGAAEMDLSKPRLKLQNVGNSTNTNVELVEEVTDLTFFTGRLLGGRGLDQGAMPQGGLTVLLMLLVLTLALTFFLAVIGFQHSAILGSVVYSVVSTHMGKRATVRQAVRAGLKSGIGRLMWLAILHVTLRGFQSLFLMKALFGGVMEMEQVEQLAVRLSVAPFAFLAPFRDVEATDLGIQFRIGLFVLLDYISDGLADTLYIVACWVTVMERNFWGFGALSRSWNLVKSILLQAFAVKLLEAVVCGRSSRWLLSQVFGQFPATLAICTAQVYFLVLWLIFYFSARSIHDGSLQFCHRNLEDFLDRFK